MTEPYKIIQELESDNSRLFKEGVIAREMKAGNDEFFLGVSIALNKLHVFNIQKVDTLSKDGPGLDHDTFWDLQIGLNTRLFTGNEARDLVAEKMEMATCEQWNDWYRRILIKDLRCGVSEKTINNVAKKLQMDKYVIPTFDVMLAHDSANHANKMHGEKFIDYKLDGVRVLAFFDPDKDTVAMYTRNGKQLHNFGHVEDEIREKIMPGFEVPTILDGEMVSKSFQALMKQVHRKENVEATDAKFAVFDMISQDEFNKGKSILGCADRDAMVNALFINKKFEHLFPLEKHKVNLDTPEGYKKYLKFNKDAIANGFEGVMIKDVDAPYECKRSHHMLKAKPFIEVTLNVMDIEQGTGRNEGRLGAFVCKGTDGDKTIEVNVGSGFSDAQRDEFWQQRDKIVNQLVEVRGDAVTQNQDGSYSLRFPRFKTFRGFEIGEKI
jgi:DNA ligase-1